MDRISKTCLLAALLVVPVAAFAGPLSNAGGRGHGGPGNAEGGPGDRGAYGNLGGSGQGPGAEHRPGPPQGNGNGNGQAGGGGGAEVDNGPGHGRGHGDPVQKGGPRGPRNEGSEDDHGPGNLAGGPGRGAGHGDGSADGDRGDDGRGGDGRDRGGEGSGDGDSRGERGVPGRGNSQGAFHANDHATQAVCRHQAAAAHSVIGVNCGGIIVAHDPRTGAHVYSQSGTDLPQATVVPPPPTSGRR